MTQIIKENYCIAGLSFLKVAEKSKVLDCLNISYGSRFFSSNRFTSANCDSLR